MAYDKEQKIRDILLKDKENLENGTGAVNTEVLSDHVKDAAYTIENLISRNEFLSEEKEKIRESFKKLETKLDEQNAYIRVMQSAIITWFIETYGGSGRE